MNKVSTGFTSFSSIAFLLLLFVLIDYWIVFLSLLLTNFSIGGYFLAFILSIVTNALIYLNSNIYIITDEEFIITNKANDLLKKDKERKKETRLNITDIRHVFVDVKVNPIHYNPTIHLKLQHKETSQKFINFAVIKDKNYKSFIWVLKLLKSNKITYEIINNNKKLEGILKENSLETKTRI